MLLCSAGAPASHTYRYGYRLHAQALRAFGTDFTLIARLFPKRGRRGVKAKYLKEERTNPKRMEEVLKYNERNFNYADFETVLQGLAREQGAESEALGPSSSVQAVSTRRVDDLEPEGVVSEAATVVGPPVYPSQEPDDEVYAY